MSRKIRSPSFPFISLPEALERARAFFDREHRHETEPEVAVRHWGYSPRSSGGNQTLAALRAFGLLEMVGEGKVRLTERAVRILLDEREESPEREQLLRQAALSPALHARIWERYKGVLPSDATLRLYLVADEGFNERSVDEFIAELKETLEYAGIEAPKPQRQEPPLPQAAIEVDPVVFPLLDGNAVELRIRRKISPEEAEDVRTMFELWLKKIVQR
ncbi:MAG TPA: hypothetical protein VF789_25575 [Thermoanaerobaculia bacterium]